MKKVPGIYGNANRHWVGDGFPVRSLFSYNTLGQHISPFLLLDYAGPADFPRTAAPRRRPASSSRLRDGDHRLPGRGRAPRLHRRRRTHRAGDVQWMTAASGILHEEYHSERFRSTGGTLEMVQLWVNLPSSDKMNPPRYQTLLDADIPRVGLPDRAGELRVIAGRYGRHQGPALTHSPLAVWDVQLKAGKHLALDLPKGHTCAVVVLRGTLAVGDEIVREAQVAPARPRRPAAGTGSQQRRAVAGAQRRAAGRADHRLWPLRDEQPRGNRPGHRGLRERALHPRPLKSAPTTWPA